MELRQTFQMGWGPHLGGLPQFYEQLRISKENNLILLTLVVKSLYHSVWE